MAIPLAYIAVNDKLADVADRTEVVIWENPDQLMAYVAGGQGDFVTMPSNNSAIFYNKGVELQLLDISVWNITYLITSDPNAAGFADIKGQSLVVPFEGSVPDLMFQYITKAEGLDPQKDFELRYAADPTQAAQLLLSGQVDNAVLSEALATAVLLQTKTAEKPLHRALAFDDAWTEASGGTESPIAGTVATASVLDKPDVIAAFQREYKAAVQWMLDNPEEAGQLVETQLPQLGLKAAVMTASLQNITWRYTTAVDARVSLEAFYQALSELSPQVIGGKLPDDGFYFNYTP
jgi:NitT/TauT family transport system substrate-binding protein